MAVVVGGRVSLGKRLHVYGGLICSTWAGLLEFSDIELGQSIMSMGLGFRGKDSTCFYDFCGLYLQIPTFASRSNFPAGNVR